MCNSFCTITVVESAYTHPPGCFLAAKTFCQRDPQKKPSLRWSGRPVGQGSHAHAIDGRDHVRSTVERPAAGEARHRGLEALQPPILPARGACDWHVHHRGQRLILANGQWQDFETMALAATRGHASSTLYGARLARFRACPICLPANLGKAILSALCHQ